MNGEQPDHQNVDGFPAKTKISQNNGKSPVVLLVSTPISHNNGKSTVIFDAFPGFERIR
jgi:hypothetical protein